MAAFKWWTKSSLKELRRDPLPGSSARLGARPRRVQGRAPGPRAAPLPAPPGPLGARSPADRRRVLISSTLVLSLGLSALPASALALPNDACIKDERCKEHHDKAVNYYNQQYFEEALSEFQAAYSARQMPLLLINIGRTLQKLGRPKEAISYYERFQQAESKPDPAVQAKVTEYLNQAKALVGTDPTPPPSEQPGETPKPPTPAPVPPPVVVAPAPPPGPPPPARGLVTRRAGPASGRVWCRAWWASSWPSRYTASSTTFTRKVGVLPSSGAWAWPSCSAIVQLCSGQAPWAPNTMPWLSGPPL